MVNVLGVYDSEYGKRPLSVVPSHGRLREPILVSDQF